nr:hypothetical protein Q903MT_gene5364 [Picea sitchensis]
MPMPAPRYAFVAPVYDTAYAFCLCCWVQIHQIEFKQLAFLFLHPMMFLSM